MRVQQDLTVTAADGTRLLLNHHLPEGRTGAPQPGGGVVVWIRTPYGRNGIASIARRFAKSGAHVLVEAMRGTDGCGGNYEPFSITAMDAAAVLAWLRSRPWFPGVIVTWGISAIGYASWALAELQVPEWRLAILQDAPSELRDGLVYPGGIFAAKTMLGFLHSAQWQARHPRAGLPRTMLASIRAARRANKVLAKLPLGSADQRLVGHRVEYFHEWLAHEHHEQYWKPLDQRCNAATLPGMVHLASGWYDLALSSTLADYHALRDAGKNVRLLVGPWYHGRGAIDKTYHADIDAWLGAAARDAARESDPVQVYVGGIDEWRELSDWPVPGHQPNAWYLHSDATLATDPPPPGPPDCYRYDPAKPTPALGGAMENLDGNAGAKDNRKLEQRPDVLTYTSHALTGELEVIGPISAQIVVRSSLAHTDLLARLCDVYPDGRSINLCDGAQRLTPAQPATAADGTRTVNLDLIGIAHVFRAGHRIRLQISSGAHPRLARNTGTGQPLATATELRIADQQIFHDPQHRSRLMLPIRSVPPRQ